MEDWSRLTPAEIRARVAAAREPALRKFLANCGAKPTAVAPAAALRVLS